MKLSGGTRALKGRRNLGSCTFVRAMARPPTTVGDLSVEEGLCVQCPCRQRTFSAAELTRLFGPDCPLNLIGLRFRCSRCGSKPHTAWITWAFKRRYEPE